ncbi:MAG TPA: PRC and DUF2382 domain-containing protein [Thermoleophilaceae bacterium]|nr:PRC and DUF2382 domain-containing protein [Thermoleophilaceae bacterium]
MTDTQSTSFGTSEVTRWRGRTMIASDGDKIGKIDEIYLDEETGRPEWALVNTGLLGMKSNFVPLTAATSEGDEVRVDYSKDQVKDAPGIDPEGQLSQQEEAALYRHYGLEYSERRSGSGLPEGGAGDAATGAAGSAGTAAAGTADTSGTSPTSAGTAGGGRFSRQGDDAMTRSEEEVRVGTAEQETGRARLRKFVETDQVEESVPVRRETARIEREPITDANVDDATSGPEITEGEHEVTLHEEEPVVEKRTVPKERVRLEKDVETDEEEISETVRKERVEQEGDVR